jgi:hypothetical protein
VHNVCACLRVIDKKADAESIRTRHAEKATAPERQSRVVRRRAFVYRLSDAGSENRVSNHKRCEHCSLM